jgi:hypothetical protein
MTRRELFMPVAIVRKRDGSVVPIECRDGMSPEVVAEQGNAELLDYCDSMGDAKYRIENNHTTKADSI